MKLSTTDFWVLAYLDQHCTSPDQAGMISVDRNWTGAGDAQSAHSRAIAAALQITSEQFEALLSRLGQFGLVGKKRTSSSMIVWITAVGQDTVRSAKLAPNSVERLSALRQELGGVPAYPWTRIEAWIAKATPLIRHDWSDHLEDFKRVAKTPRWTALPVFFGRDHAENDATIARTNAIEESSNRAIAQERKSQILAFLDGLLSVAESLSASSDSELITTGEQGDEILDRAEMTTPRSTKDVFLVHGRNIDARNSMCALLRALGLHPLEWSGIVHATGKTAPYVGEVLKKGFELAQVTVVLMTPDDEARLIQRFWGEGEPPYETSLTPQARQNVLIEAGMALGLDEHHTIIVELGRLRPTSDLIGRHVIRMVNSPECRQELAQRLKTAGCDVNQQGTDWLNAGDFIGPVSHSEPANPPSQKPDLFASDNVLWSVSQIGSQSVFLPHCPQCHAPLNRVADVVNCTKCSFQELLPQRVPSSVPGQKRGRDSFGLNRVASPFPLPPKPDPVAENIRPRVRVAPPTMKSIEPSTEPVKCEVVITNGGKTPAKIEWLTMCMFYERSHMDIFGDVDQSDVMLPNMIDHPILAAEESLTLNVPGNVSMDSVIQRQSNILVRVRVTYTDSNGHQFLTHGLFRFDAAQGQFYAFEPPNPARTSQYRYNLNDVAVTS